MAKVQRTLKKALLVKELRPVEQNVLSRDCEVFATLQFLCPKSLKFFCLQKVQLRSVHVISYDRLASQKVLVLDKYAQKVFAVQFMNLWRIKYETV